MVLEDRDGILLGAHIASDGQWRFPKQDSVPDKFKQAIITFEDKRFYRHPGVDLLSLGRAMRQNISQRRVVSGGSTLSMQTIRLAYDNPSRTIFQKILEIIRATRLEWRYSKEEILSLYAANAPFGGNVVGLEAASWRYFGKAPELLSWAEASMLAVLPNSPGLIHPGRNRDQLLKKRNRLLDQLQEQGIIDNITNELAKEEALPDKPLALPNKAPHLLVSAPRLWNKKEKTARIRSSIVSRYQQQANAIAQRHQRVLKGNGIHHLSILVADVKSGEVLAYVGNVPKSDDARGSDVDVIQSARSTGSILKPFLYAMALDEGVILPNTLLPDVPMNISGYKPENYYEKYDGVVPARRVLSRSLNVPMVKLLQDYGLQRFHHQLKRLGFTTFAKNSGHYGLTLILGGGEANLWELTSAYASMARLEQQYVNHKGKYNENAIRPLSITLSNKKKESFTKKNSLISAGAIWHTFEAMQELQRPNSEGEWKRFESERRIAWKTGTSYGFRDAWAIGLTPDYVVGIWVGNADGEGRPGLVGVRAAAPVLFDVFDMLPRSSSWFQAPFDDMIQLEVCSQSGYLPGMNCPKETIWASLKGEKAKSCPYHRIVHTNADASYQVNADCEPVENILHQAWFVLPPLQEYYYTQKHPEYRPLPPLRSDCIEEINQQKNMELIYPKEGTQIAVPTDLDGERSRVVFELAHRDPSKEVYWHIDNMYMGATKDFHTMEFLPTKGRHVLTVVDEIGNRLEVNFEVVK